VILPWPEVWNNDAGGIEIADAGFMEKFGCYQISIQ